jgi:hypothetical protein
MRKSQLLLLLAVLATLVTSTVIISESNIRYVKVGPNKVAIIIDDECDDDRKVNHKKSDSGSIEALAALYGQGTGDVQLTKTVKRGGSTKTKVVSYEVNHETTQNPSVVSSE